jgi:peptide/nickel transport system substrate-binding protein
MNGLAKPAKGQVDPQSPWFGKPSFDIKYDPEEAKRLVAEAGYSPEKPLKATFVIAQGGTGQMLSLPMNEFLQESFKEIGIQIDFKVVELETLYTHWRKGAKDEMNAGITANNIAYVTSDPLLALIRFFDSRQTAPTGVNWGFYANPKVDALIDEAKRTFDVAKQDALMAQVHALVVDDAPLVWVVHDTNPHALSPKVKQFVQAQHWFQDLTTIGLE